MQVCSVCRKTIIDPNGDMEQCPHCGNDLVATTETILHDTSVQETVDLPSVAVPEFFDEVSNERYRIEVRRRSIVGAGDTSDPSAEYVIHDLIGEGGMGEVYLARQTSIDREIALKMVRSRYVGDPVIRGKFLAEVAVTSDLDHPNIVPIHEIGVSADGQLFYTMKRVRGTPWNKVLVQRSREQNLDTLTHVCNAVAFAHSRGVIHRDLKPENVMLGDFGEVFVMDWGMAVSVNDSGRAAPLGTLSGIAGTPAYMAPEMASANHAALGAHSDVYLLGAILYEIITGDCPHVGSTLEETLEAARKNVIRRPATGGELAQIAIKAMDSTPEERYASVQEFLEAIQNYRAHAHSLFLASRAQEDFRQAQKTKSYDHFNQALFGFREALLLWDGNGFAREQIKDVSLAYATCAYYKNDYDLALSLLNTDDARATALATTVTEARTARERRDRRFHLLRVGLVALVGLVCCVILISTLVVKNAHTKTKILQEKVDIQQQRAIKAEQGQKELQQQREDIWQPVVAYDFSTVEPDALDFKCELVNPQSSSTSNESGTPYMTLDNGVLRLLRTPIEMRSQLVWKEAVTEETRVEATVLNSSEEGPNLDINISGDATTGYRLRVYGYNHVQFETESDRTWERLYRCPIELDPNATSYTFTLWRTGNTFVAQIDGKEVMRLNDPLAQRGRRHRTFSVGRYGERGSCDFLSLRIMRRQDPQLVSVLEPGKVLLRMNYVKAAREWFERMVMERTEPDIRGEAQFLLATIARSDADKIAQLTAIGKDDTNPFRVNALRDLAYMEYSANNLDGAINALTDLSKIRPEDPTPQHFFGIVRPRIVDAKGSARTKLCEQLGRLHVRTLELDGLHLDTFDPFANMTSVHFLDISENPIGGLEALQKLNRLRTLYCRYTGITSLEPLRGLPLDVLDCSENEITDLSPLRGMKLRKLIFSAKSVTSGWDVLKEMPTLEYIDGTGKRNTKQKAADFWLWLKASHPAAVVSPESAAALGKTGTTNNTEAPTSPVTPNSAP